MKTLLTLILISFCSIAFGQPSKHYKESFEKADKLIIASSNGITVTDDVRLNQLGLDRKVIFSKGEALQEKDWQEFLKNWKAEEKLRQKYFRSRDSTHSVFINYTASPIINPGDTVESFRVTLQEIDLRLKPKKK